MKTKRLNLEDFKLKQSHDASEISKLMGNVLGNCHDVEHNQCLRNDGVVVIDPPHNQ